MCHPPSPNLADLSPLSYGTGLALGLMLILGLPRPPADPEHAAQPVARYRPDISLVLRQAERDQPVARRR